MTFKANESSEPATYSEAMRPILVGIDSLYLSSFIDGVGIEWQHLACERERLRSSPSLDYVEIEFGGETFALRRSARRPYSYRLSNGAFILLLSERMQPRCYAQFTSELLWSPGGLLAALDRYNKIWKTLGSRASRPDMVSRVDAAFDFHIGKPDFDYQDFVSRAAKDTAWRKHRKYQTFCFGTSAVVWRVYDKCAEIEEESKKYWFYDRWQTRTGVWRFECQLRRPCLEEAGIVTLEDLRAHLPALVRRLATEHTSLRVPTSDSNRSRWPRHPTWEAMIASADGLVTPPRNASPPRRNGAQYRLQRQLRSMYGNLEGLAATVSRNRPDEPLTLDQLMAWLPRALKRHHSPQLWKADVRTKIRKRELGL
jgi:hypothetical protein